MRKYILWLLLLLTCSSVTKGQRFFNVTADEVKIDSLLPVFTYSVPLGAGYADSVYTVGISYPEFIDMSGVDISRYKSIAGDVLPPAMPEVNSRVVVERKQGRIEVSFVPIVYRGGKYRKLVSFMIEVRSHALSARRKVSAVSEREGDISRYAEHSVLATGRWAKIRVPSTGIYQLTETLVRRAGFSNINKVRIYGYGGALQNETLVGSELAATDDLREVPTCVIGGRRLFHAQGPVSWSSRTATERTRNPYSDYGYYFITQTDGEPLSVDSTEFVNSFYPANDDYHTLHEIDNYAWFEGGRNLFENSPINSGASRTYTIETPGTDSNGTISVAVTSGTAAVATIEVNDSIVGTLRMSINSSYDHGAESKGIYKIRNLLASNTVKITTTSGGPVRLDYISATFDTPRPLPNIRTATFASPEYVYNITNQDLHADRGYHMVIIVPASQKLTAQAERIKTLHEQHDGMKVRIVPADELYNEFSSGTPDANAYRRYMKMLYDRAETEEDMPAHLLLFGDCAWDNRMNSSAWTGYSPDDFLLCHESENSFSSVNCYVDDGFFCSLDDGEGGNPLSGDKHDIAVGRFPVRTAAEAQIMVDKTINYVQNREAGNWQNVVMFMGDDGNENRHMEDADDAARLVESLNPAMYVKRVMWDAYQRISSSTGYSYPEVTKLIKQQQNSGALIMDYCGHGGPQGLSHEYALRLQDVKEFTNTRLPLWITASCDIAAFDGQTENIGEQLLLNSKGGAVALFGTTRTVYVDRNKAINMAFLRQLFTPRNGRYIPIGEAQRLAKNYLIDTGGDRTINKLQYSLLGDPALVLNMPTLTAVIDSINDRPVDSADMAALRSGSVATVKGHIERDGVKDNTFRGKVTVTVRDAEEKIVCRLNNTSSEGASTPMTYYDRTKVLFSGSDSVRAGEFRFSFAVPMDIRYTSETGLLNVYAVNNNMDDMANGYCSRFTVGGTDVASNDSIGPSIYCYLNSPMFTDGGDVNTTPYFVAKITDRDGLNTTGTGVGHDMQLIIDGDMTKTYNLNDNFVFDFGSYTTGTTYYNIPELTPGHHKLKFRAWDILNNPATAELSFNVVKGLDPTLFSVDVTDNPARTSTTFIINHDRTGSNMDVVIEVFDTGGRLLWTHEETAVPTSMAYTVNWDLIVSSGHKLRTGIYLYRVRIGGSDKVSKTKKLIVINNN